MNVVKLNNPRVWRTYTGGKSIDEFHGKEGIDNHYPEEWIMSTTQAINPNNPVVEGLSVIDNSAEEYGLENIEVDKLKDTVIMHELFHYLEDIYVDGFSNEKHVDVKIFGIFKSKSSLSVVSEIASVHFSKLVTNLSHTPLVYNQIYKLKK